MATKNVNGLPNGVVDGDVESALVEFMWTNVDAGQTDGASATVRSLVLAVKKKNSYMIII